MMIGRLGKIQLYQNLLNNCRYCRVLVPKNKAKRNEVIRQGISRIRANKSSSEIHMSVRQMPAPEEVDDNDDDDDDDDHTVRTMGTGIMRDTGGREFEGWKARYRIPVGSVAVKKVNGRSLFVSINLGKALQERELIFDTADDLEGFCQRLNKEQETEEDRKQWKIEAALGGIKLPKFETISLLIEIVSCWDIPAGDFGGTSDPYVVCMMGEQQIHKTDVVYKT